MVLRFGSSLAQGVVPQGWAGKTVIGLGRAGGGPLGWGDDWIRLRKSQRRGAVMVSSGQPPKAAEERPTPAGNRGKHTSGAEAHFAFNASTARLKQILKLYRPWGFPSGAKAH